MEANSELIWALSGVVVGVLLGVFGSRLLNKNYRENKRMQQALLESERQVEELKTRMGAHLLDTHQHVDTLRDTAHQLEQLLANEAHYWQLDDNKLHGRILGNNDHQEPGEPHYRNDNENTSASGVPRDYADGKSGTLSEDFGLKTQDQAPQPPRY